jgi:hypothetical protein
MNCQGRISFSFFFFFSFFFLLFFCGWGEFLQLGDFFFRKGKIREFKEIFSAFFQNEIIKLATFKPRHFVTTTLL